MTGEKLIREIVLQAKDEPHGRSGGWIVIKVTGVSDRDLNLHIRAAGKRKLLDVLNIDSFDAPYPEWKVQGITADGLQFLRDTKLSKKVRRLLWAGAVALVGFLGWLIPLLISIRKK